MNTTMLYGLLYLISISSAFDLCFYNGLDCGGSRTCCGGIALNRCCTSPLSDFCVDGRCTNCNSRDHKVRGWFASNCPGNAPISCQNTVPQVPPRESCCLGVLGTRCSLKVNAAGAVARDETSAGNGTAECAEPNKMIFEDEDGKERQIYLPRGTFSQAADLLKVKNWQKLREYDDWADQGYEDERYLLD